MRRTFYSCDLCAKELCEAQVKAIGQLFVARVQTSYGLSTQVKIIAHVDEESSLDICKDCLLKILKTL